ncbi:MAG: hypothetical protein IJ689_02185 [Alphaproteobacteria bacterium]|nr:hypothetical protein [Alphaproteobacteria bacterium]
MKRVILVLGFHHLSLSFAPKRKSAVWLYAAGCPQNTLLKLNMRDYYKDSDEHPAAPLEFHWCSFSS